MQSRPSFFAQTAEPQPTYPTSIDAHNPAQERQVRDASGVGDDAITDADREEQITRHGRQMIAAYARYERTSCFADVGQAHFHRMRMYALIRGRSAGKVARMEADRGIA